MTFEEFEQHRASELARLKAWSEGRVCEVEELASAAILTQHRAKLQNACRDYAVAAGWVGDVDTVALQMMRAAVFDLEN